MCNSVPRAGKFRPKGRQKPQAQGLEAGVPSWEFRAPEEPITLSHAWAEGRHQTLVLPRAIALLGPDVTTLIPSPQPRTLLSPLPLAALG